MNNPTKASARASTSKVRYFDADEGRLWDQVVLAHLQANCFDVDAALTVAESVIYARRRTGR